MLCPAERKIGDKAIRKTQNEWKRCMSKCFWTRIIFIGLKDFIWKPVVNGSFVDAFRKFVEKSVDERQGVIIAAGATVSI